MVNREEEISFSVYTMKGNVVINCAKQKNFPSTLPCNTFFILFFCSKSLLEDLCRLLIPKETLRMIELGLMTACLFCCPVYVAQVAWIER